MPVDLAYAANVAALGHEVARLRKAKGWSVEMLAGTAGVGARTIVNIESAQRAPMITTLYSVARALDADLGELVSVL